MKKEDKRGLPAQSGREIIPLCPQKDNGKEMQNNKDAHA